MVGKAKEEGVEEGSWRKIAFGRRERRDEELARGWRLRLSTMMGAQGRKGSVGIVSGTPEVT
jgi:hypothetical protein